MFVAKALIILPTIEAEHVCYCITIEISNWKKKHKADNPTDAIGIFEEFRRDDFDV